MTNTIVPIVIGVVFGLSVIIPIFTLIFKLIYFSFCSKITIESITGEVAVLDLKKKDVDATIRFANILLGRK